MNRIYIEILEKEDGTHIIGWIICESKDILRKEYTGKEIQTKEYGVAKQVKVTTRYDDGLDGYLCYELNEIASRKGLKDADNDKDLIEVPDRETLIENIEYNIKQERKSKFKVIKN